MVIVEISVILFFIICIYSIDSEIQSNVKVYY